MLNLVSHAARCRMASHNTRVTTTNLTPPIRATMEVCIPLFGEKTFLNDGPP